MEEGFQENLSGWYEEIKKKKEQGIQVNVVGADEEEYSLDVQVVMILLNQPGIQYQENIQGHDIEGSWHLRRQGERVPQGVEPIDMVEVGPGEYRRLSAIEAEEELAQEISQISLQEELRPFEKIFEELREPFP